MNELTVRPVVAADVERLARMFGRLSPESLRTRFFSPLPRVPCSALLKMADVDHCRRDGLVALDGAEIVAIASYAEVPQPSGQEVREAELAVTVEDTWQHRGVGLQLARDLAALAEARGYDALVASVLPENRAALGLLRKLRPDASVAFAGGEYEARLPLAS